MDQYASRVLPRWRTPLALVVVAGAALGTALLARAEQGGPPRHDGREVFRFDTFGDEAQWTDTLRMHEVIQSAVDPVTALSVGLKVDADALPAGRAAERRPARARPPRWR